MGAIKGMFTTCMLGQRIAHVISIATNRIERPLHRMYARQAMGDGKVHDGAFSADVSESPTAMRAARAWDSDGSMR